MLITATPCHDNMLYWRCARMFNCRLLGRHTKLYVYSSIQTYLVGSVCKNKIEFHNGLFNRDLPYIYTGTTFDLVGYDYISIIVFVIVVHIVSLLFAEYHDCGDSLPHQCCQGY